jgi:hypothetical protein
MPAGPLGRVDLAHARTLADLLRLRLPASEIVLSHKVGRTFTGASAMRAGPALAAPASPRVAHDAASLTEIVRHRCAHRI